MSETITIANQNIPLVEYQSQRVVTFAMIDRVHQRPEGTARRNFNQNKSRFINGDDFYTIDSKGLYEFRTSGVFPESANSGTLITESGYLMLVKSFNDDLAWQVQRELVTAYFRVKPMNKSNDRPRLKFPHLLHGFYRGTTLARLTRMERELVGHGVHDFGLTSKQARERALVILTENLGKDPTFLFRGLPIIVPEPKKSKNRKNEKPIADDEKTLAECNPLEPAQKVPAPDVVQVDHNLCGSAPVLGFVPYLTATQMAEQLNLRFSTDRPNGHAVNDLLCAMGLAYRLADNRILPTHDGENVCRRRPALDARGQPIPGYETLTWDARVTDRLRQFVKNHPSQMPLF
ncbi:ORF6N domain-containing protein [Acidithiobacillus thiooxidans]|uniref:ORF6N domain-containing protein n=1 Tax=Acidithiobacillus TaxID=119977 RepID=UPI0002624CD5|nr:MULTISPECIES: ORF6N domain-containing protein [Acidithiobacillus]MBU2741818.1 ORF6N domain-containing protein [Acidithiobacillus albertensis]MBU2812677.1 ORF6N domain-containing protein [Acidithiobacillus thiooxidans]MBU2834872.1 ORF6N domain-containing protein [Acidithiobacillus thiooxidans]MDR7927226.1 ORF6N domain-containing protein [Acidithiobacillus thiooxidans]